MSIESSANTTPTPTGDQKPQPIAPAKRALVVIDVNANKVFVKTNAQAESAIMHPTNKRWIALKGKSIRDGVMIKMFQLEPDCRFSTFAIERELVVVT